MSSQKKFSKNPNLLFIIFSMVLPFISGLIINFIFTSRIWRGTGMLIVFYALITMTSIVIVISFFFGYLFYNKKKFLYYFPILFLIFFRFLPYLILVLFYNFPIRSLFSPSGSFILVLFVIVSEYIGYFFSMNKDKKVVQNQNHFKQYSTYIPKDYQQSNNRYCPYCGASIKFKDFYCIKCGKSLKVEKS